MWFWGGGGTFELSIIISSNVSISGQLHLICVIMYMFILILLTIFKQDLMTYSLNYTVIGLNIIRDGDIVILCFYVCLSSIYFFWFVLLLSFELNFN